MSAVGPGDWVECVDVAPRPNQPSRYRVALAQLQVGKLYRVVGEAEIRGLIIEGVRAAAEPALGWKVERFRPIYRPKQELIETLKAPPERARVLETA